MSFYAIVCGNQNHICTSNSEAAQYVSSWRGSTLKRFQTMEQAQAFCQPKTNPSFTKSSKVTSVVSSSVCFFDSYSSPKGSGYGIVVANPNGSVHEVYGFLGSIDKNRAILMAFVTLIDNFDGNMVIITQSDHILRTFTQIGNVWADMNEMVDGDLITHAFDSMEDRDIVFGSPKDKIQRSSMEKAHNLAIKGASRKSKFVETVI